MAGSPCTRRRPTWHCGSSCCTLPCTGGGSAESCGRSGTVGQRLRPLQSSERPVSLATEPHVALDSLSDCTFRGGVACGDTAHQEHLRSDDRDRVAVPDECWPGGGIDRIRLTESHLCDLHGRRLRTSRARIFQCLPMRGSRFPERRRSSSSRPGRRCGSRRMGGVQSVARRVGAPGLSRRSPFRRHPSSP